MLVSLGAALGAVELGVRLLHLEPDRFWEYDARLGSRLVPGRKGWWTQEEREFVVPVTINAEGWRDVEHTVEKPEGVFRILLLGDSFTEAMQVPLEATYGRVLEDKLNQSEPEKRVEVINNGVSGYGTAGELLLFEEEGSRYRPDLVLLAFYPGNDIMNNSPEVEDTLIPVYAADGTIERVKPAGGEGRKPKAKGLLARSKAYRYFRRQLLTRHPDLAKRLAAWGIGPRDGVKTAKMFDGVPAAYFVYAPPDPVWEAAWDRTRRLLSDLKAETAKVGARLVVAVVSSRDEVYPEKWQEILAAYPAMQGRAWDVEAPRRRIVDLCRTEGIPVIELTPAMRASGSHDLLHFSSDGHWTPAGHRLAGETIARALVEQGLVPTKGEGHNVTR